MALNPGCTWELLVNWKKKKMMCGFHLYMFLHGSPGDSHVQPGLRTCNCQLNVLPPALPSSGQFSTLLQEEASKNINLIKSLPCSNRPLAAPWHKDTFFCIIGKSLKSWLLSRAFQPHPFPSLPLLLSTWMHFVSATLDFLSLDFPWISMHALYSFTHEPLNTCNWRGLNESGHQGTAGEGVGAWEGLTPCREVTNTSTIRKKMENSLKAEITVSIASFPFSYPSGPSLEDMKQILIRITFSGNTP